MTDFAQVLLLTFRREYKCSVYKTEEHAFSRPCLRILRENNSRYDHFVSLIQVEQEHRYSICCDGTIYSRATHISLPPLLFTLFTNVLHCKEAMYFY